MTGGGHSGGAATTATVVVDGLSHHFRGEGGEIRVLRDISLRVGAGEFVALVGPSGCGKTTLLRMIAGLLEPEVGRILYRGTPLNGPPAGVGFVFQKPALLPWRSVEENIRLPLQVRGDQPPPERVPAMIEAVGLAGFEQALPATLSGGMQQRVALARAMVVEPRLLLMDEPFGALDMVLRSEMNRLLLTIWERTHPTVLFVTHDAHEAVFLADRVIVMSPRPGRIVGNFPIELPRPRTQLARYGPEIAAYVARIWPLLEA